MRRPWKVSLHNAPVIENTRLPGRSLILKALWIAFSTGFFPRKIEAKGIPSPPPPRSLGPSAEERVSRKKESAIYLGSKLAQRGQTLLPRAREGRREEEEAVLSHPLCGASHSVQSRCSISFPYPMIPSHVLSSNRFKSAFTGARRTRFRREREREKDRGMKETTRPFGFRRSPIEDWQRGDIRAT